MTGVMLQNLTRRFGKDVAVNNLNLRIESGELIALLGPSGCGKTTTLEMITGLLQPTLGDVLFDGKSILTIPTEKRGAVMVFQKHLLFPNMNIAQNVGFGLKMAKVSQKEINRRVSKMLDLVCLPGFEKRRPHELSSGQQQRVALARALIIQPKVLLLDEPLANLDTNLRLEMRELIHEIQRELAITTLFVTHDQEEAVMMADRIALMFNGKLQQFGEPQTFYDAPLTVEIARFFRNNNFLPGIRRNDIVETELGMLKIDTNRINQPNGEVLLTIRPERINITHSVQENSLWGAVRAVVYVGTHTQLLLDVMGHQWSAHCPVDFTARVGDIIPLQLPQSHIWLLPHSEKLIRQHIENLVLLRKMQT